MNIEDYKKYIECLDIALASNFKWCLDCKKDVDECIVMKNNMLFRNY